MRYKTKVGFNVNVSNSITEVEAKVTLKKETINYKRYMLSQSLRVATPWTVSCGLNNDDFMRDMFTCAVTGFAVKIPRIIKNMLLKRPGGVIGDAQPITGKRR